MAKAIRLFAFLAATLSLTATVSAKSGLGQACDTIHNHLDSDTYNLVTDCDAQTYCAPDKTCKARGCRRDEFPYGYNGVPFSQLPPLCAQGQFCPDESDQCLNEVPVGGACQKDRDDQCQPPPNAADLTGYRNINGSVCLNYTCYWANATLGQTCVNDNNVYTGYTETGSAFAFIVSRDNCANGTYCDASALKCFKGKLFGETCQANKECVSFNCQSDGHCGKAADEPIHPPPYAYAIVGVGIVLLILAVFVGLFFFHRRTRKENQIRLEQYYNEQVTYRQSIMSMSHARNSLMSLPIDMPPDVARRSILGETAYSSATDNAANPPNMRRDSSAAWSEADSDAYLIKGGKNTRF